jgi:hypothetical protein
LRDIRPGGHKTVRSREGRIFVIESFVLKKKKKKKKKRECEREKEERTPVRGY